MKTTIKTLVLVLLMAVMCTSTYIVVMAAEDIAPAQGNAFANDGEMATYSGPELRAAPRAAASSEGGTRLGGNRVSDIENAPALRYNQEVTIPQVDLTPSESEATHSPPPQTGPVSFTSLFLCGLGLIGCAGFMMRKGKELTAEA